MNDEYDGYALARPMRRDGPGCPLCGAEIEPTKGERWPQHSPPGEPKNAKCDLSGLGTYYPTDEYFRTFHARDSPEGFPESGHRVTTTLESFGDAIGFDNALAVPVRAFGSGGIVARVATLVTKADYPRLRDELDRLAQDLGWGFDVQGGERRWIVNGAPSWQPLRQNRKGGSIVAATTDPEKYPQAAKLDDLRTEAETAGQFFERLMAKPELHLVRYIDDEFDGEPVPVPACLNGPELVAEFLGIDYKAYQLEKDAMLKEIQERHERTDA